MKTVNDIIKHVTASPGMKLAYHTRYHNSLRITVFSDFSFSVNDNSPSQVGYMIFLPHMYHNSNRIEYTSVKSGHVVRSILGAETFTLAHAFDSAILFQ